MYVGDDDLYSILIVYGSDNQLELEISNMKIIKRMNLMI